MSPRLTYFATFENGSLKISDRTRFANELTKFYEGKRIEITVQKAKKKKSNEQNRYLFGCVYEYALQGLKDAGNVGLTIEDIHDFFKDRFLSEGKQIVIPETGETKIVAKSTKNLSTTEMCLYIEEIAKFCAEMLNTEIPAPYTQTEMNIQ